MIQANKNAWVLRALVAIALASLFVWDTWFQKGFVGYSATIQGDRARVVAGSNPAVVLLSVLATVLFCVLTKAKVRVGEYQPASLELRFASFLIDIWFVSFSTSGLSSFICLLLEAHRTGTFQWHFERSYSVSSDFIAFLIVLVDLALIVSYFVIPLSKCRQTVGCWIFRLATVSGSGDVLYMPVSTAAWRVFMQANAIAHPIRTFKERDAQGRTWYDRETGLTVVRY